MYVTNGLASAVPEALCSELQQEKQRLESHVSKLKDSLDQLRGEVQELAQRERLLVSFPELNPLPQGPPQSRITSLNNSEHFLYVNHNVDITCTTCIVCIVLFVHVGLLTYGFKYKYQYYKHRPSYNSSAFGKYSVPLTFSTFCYFTALF